MWGWTESLTGWSLEQKQFLQKCWRDSSSKTYKQAWKKWCDWARSNSVNNVRPEGADLARFLIDLHQVHGLAYSTILLYKSAVSTLCDPTLQNPLSSHILVRQVLKSISNSSIKSKTNKPPIWDTENLVRWLSVNIPDSDNLFQCSARAAILLLLCSGRRVHDLTLLSIGHSNYSFQNNCIIFWPKYGSKTDTVTNRQSGWRLKENTENRALDPLFWINRVISLSQSRRALCGADNLFLTTCGAPKAASRTVIAGWVKKVLLQAGIKASPGSIRSAVASKSWIQSCPLDEILARGNWRSENTFLKFYCREISESRHNRHTITNLFTPVSE